MILSVIIVNWNTGDLLRRCLESIYAELAEVQAEIFVVDSASTDFSLAAASEQFPQVNYIISPVNVGFGSANNLALRQARGDYLLLLNPDTLVHPGAIIALIDFMEQNPQGGASTARLLNSDGSLQYSCSPEPTLGREFLRMFHLGGVRPDGYYSMETWSLAIPRQVDVILGACMLVRRTALDQAGLFDERFFMYSEEVDLCRRIRLAGWEISWVPSAMVTHYGAQSTRQMAAEMFVQLYRAKIEFFRKHHGSSQASLYKLILYFSGLPRLILAPVGRLEPAPRGEKHRTIAKNYQRLLRALPGL
jgi:GT2 family glycosyltransferase